MTAAYAQKVMYPFNREELMEYMKAFAIARGGREATHILIPPEMEHALRKWSADEWGSKAVEQEMRAGARPAKLFGLNVIWEAQQFALHNPELGDALFFDELREILQTHHGWKVSEYKGEKILHKLCSKEEEKQWEAFLTDIKAPVEVAKTAHFKNRDLADGYCIALQELNIRNSGVLPCMGGSTWTVTRYQ